MNSNESFNKESVLLALITDVKMETTDGNSLMETASEKLLMKKSVERQKLSSTNLQPFPPNVQNSTKVPKMHRTCVKMQQLNSVYV